MTFKAGSFIHIDNITFNTPGEPKLASENLDIGEYSEFGILITKELLGYALDSYQSAWAREVLDSAPTHYLKRLLDEALLVYSRAGRFTPPKCLTRYMVEIGPKMVIEGALGANIGSRKLAELLTLVDDLEALTAEGVLDGLRTKHMIALVVNGYLPADQVFSHLVDKLASGGVRRMINKRLVTTDMMNEALDVWGVSDPIMRPVLLANMHKAIDS